MVNTTYLTRAEASSECLRLPNASFLSQVNADTALVSHATEKMVYGVFQLGGSMAVCVAGIPGNFVNLIVFRRMGLKDRVNLCLFWLSFCDMMSLAAHVLRSGELAVQFYSGAAGQELRMMRSDMAAVLYDYGLGTVTGFRQISFFMYALIALDRCLCVLMPLRIRHVLTDTSTTLVVILAGSLLSFALNAFSILSIGTLCVVFLDTGFRGYSIGPSSLVRSNPGFLRFSMALDSFVLGLALPVLFLGTVVVSTAITAVILRRRERWLRQITFTSSTDTSTHHPERYQPQSGGRDHSGAGSGQEAAVTKMLVMVSSVYVLCTLPLFLHRLVRFLLPGFFMRGTYGNLYMVTYYVNSFLVNVNAAVNFLVFYRQGTRFRKQVQALFRTCCSCSAARDLRHANGESHTARYRPGVTEVSTIPGNRTLGSSYRTKDGETVY